MTFINYAAREINCKIVYYGPGLCGKTTNIQHIYKKTNPHRQSLRGLIADDLHQLRGPRNQLQDRVLRSRSVREDDEHPAHLQKDQSTSTISSRTDRR